MTAGGRDAEVLAARLLDQYEHHYHLLVSILKGIVLYAASTSIAAIYSRWQGVLAVIVTFGSVAGLVASEQARRRIMTTVTANAGRPAHRLGTPP